MHRRPIGTNSARPVRAPTHRGCTPCLRSSPTMVTDSPHGSTPGPSEKTGSFPIPARRRACQTDAMATSPRVEELRNAQRSRASRSAPSVRWKAHVGRDRPIHWGPRTGRSDSPLQAVRQHAFLPHCRATVRDGESLEIELPRRWRRPVPFPFPQERPTRRSRGRRPRPMHPGNPSLVEHDLQMTFGDRGCRTTTFHMARWRTGTAPTAVARGNREAPPRIRRRSRRPAI